MAEEMDQVVQEEPEGQDAQVVELDEDQELAYQNYEACSTLLLFCSNMFYFPPTKESLTALVEHRDIFKQPPFKTISSGSFELEKVLATAADTDKGKSAFVHIVREDFAYLFGAVLLSRTSPYESVYRTEDHVKHGPQTDEVRAFYEKCGVEIGAKRDEPDDHIGLEMGFAAEMFGRAAQQVLQSDDEGLEETLANLKEFFSDHLLVFGPTVLHNFGVRARTTYYQNLARIATASLEKAAKVLGAEASDELHEDFWMETEA